MPTKLFTKHTADHTIGFNGKEYAVKNGSVDVPDEAVAVLCEAHGFMPNPIDIEKVEEKTPSFDLAALTKNQLIAINVDAALGAELKMAMTKDEMYAVIKPLWEAQQLNKAA